MPLAQELTICICSPLLYSDHLQHPSGGPRSASSILQMGLTHRHRIALPTQMLASAPQMTKGDVCEQLVLTFLLVRFCLPVGKGPL